MIDIYGYWRSAATFRVRAALNLKGLPFRETTIGLEAGEQYGARYTDINPAAAVPSLVVDEGEPITQSLAILEYLEELHPQPALLPADARGRARVRSIALFFAADNHPLIVPRVTQYLGEALRADAHQQSEWVRHWLRKGLVQAEAWLARTSATGRFCHGDHPTIADLCLISHVVAARGSDLSTADLPTIERISRSCLELDGIASAAPMRQPDAPARQ